MDGKKMIVFYGQTCPHCRAIMPILDRLENEDGVLLERLEVWNNPENQERMEALTHLYEKESGGNMIVPSFYDPVTDRLLCNPGSYEKLKQWMDVSLK
jgi:thiol-disulfide isomerase/thioredoxin